MAERALEVEARLKEAAATVVGLKDKVCCLEKDYKAAKSQAGSKSNSPPPSTSTTTNVVDNHDIIKERLEVAEAQLAHDSDLVSKLYHRVCVLNSSLVEAKNKGAQQQQQGSSAGAITATSPRRLYVKHHRHPKAGSSCDGSAKTSPRDGDPKDGDNFASTSAGSSAVTSPRSDQLANASAELPRPLNDHEVDWILHVCGKNFEDVGIKLSDANEKLISQLRDRVRVLTDEAKKDRTPSPGRSPEGTTTPPRSGVMSPAAAVSPFQPSPGVINIGEAPSVTVQKMEDSLTQVQNRCKALAAEIDYMEKKKAAAVDAIKTLDAAISEKLPLLKSATLDAKRLRRCLKRSEEEEEPIKETRLANLIKLFKKPDKNIEKYLINRRGNKFDV
ncbi:uncharacterized protein LOC112342164 isoform X2 [Selaginella moellendorffii]|nr:uncharacterized protein LOC112342164 isoform X2 [Selaginella moellendorffii]|eukprot:XP_024519310.1 uncharacterized protein LOC112342164 isoform X2 [Selaginella moellendorffii]